MLFIAFLSLAILMALEFLNTYARLAGTEINNLSIGITVQNSLSVISRALSAFAVPLISILADLKYYENYYYHEIALANCLVPIVLYCCYCARRKISGVFLKMALSIKERGKIGLGYEELKFSNRRLRKKHLSSFFNLYYFSYLSYYMAWPATIMLLKLVPDFRATVLSTSTVLTGINTLLISLIIDPKIMYLNKYKFTIKLILIHQVKIKLMASIHSSIIFILAALIIR